MKRFWTAAAGFALAAALLWLFFRRTDWSGLREALAHAKLEYLAAALALVAMSFGLRALRWGYLLAPVAATPFRTRLRTFLEGYTVTNLVPGRVGEVVRPYLLSRDAPRAPFTAALATIVVERVLDALTLGVMLAAFLALAAEGASSEGFRRALYAGAVVGLAAVAALFAFLAYAARRKERAARLLSRLLAPLSARLRERAEGAFAQFARGLDSLREPRLLAALAASSLALWLSIALYTWFSLLAVKVDTGFFSTFLFVPVTALGISLPTPGGIGGYHAAFQLALFDVYGVEGGAAAAGILLAHAVSYLPLTLVGLALLARRGAAWGGGLLPPDGAKGGGKTSAP